LIAISPESRRLPKKVFVKCQQFFLDRLRRISKGGYANFGGSGSWLPRRERLTTAI
jgi:hypothetical protein